MEFGFIIINFKKGFFNFKLSFFLKKIDKTLQPSVSTSQVLFLFKCQIYWITKNVFAVFNNGCCKDFKYKDRNMWIKLNTNNPKWVHPIIIMKWLVYRIKLDIKSKGWGQPVI